MEKQHFSVARVATHTKENISKFERHDERKNTTYSNTNIVAERIPMNIYFKRYDSTLNQKFDEMVKNGQISTRGLKANAKIYNELVFDVNSLYFEQNGGYEFAKRFYEKAYNFAEQEDRNKYQKAGERLIANKYETMCKEASIEYDMTEYEEENNILHCYLNIKFKDISERIIQEINVNPRV